MESRWKRKALSRWSSVYCVMRLPSSHKKSTPSLLTAPIVLAATGTNEYDWASGAFLFAAAATAATPGVWDVSCTYDWSSVSLTVTSHVTHFPCFHGSTVTPSGCLPSVLSRPDGSFNARMSTFAIAHHTRSFRLWYLAVRQLPICTIDHAVLLRKQTLCEGTGKQCWNK